MTTPKLTRDEYYTLRDWWFAACPVAHRQIDGKEAVRILGRLIERLNTSREAYEATVQDDGS